MKFVLSGLILLSIMSTKSFAATDEDLAAVCYTAGVGKLMIKAEQMGCLVKVRDIQATQVDNAWYKPTKTIEFSATGDCGQVMEKVEYTNRHCR